MDAVHECLRDFLANLLVDAPAAVQHVESWWGRQRQGRESLVDFLSRQGVLAGDAARTLEFIAKGYLAPSCRASLLARGGQERLLAALGVGEPAPARKSPASTQVRRAPVEAMDPAAVETRNRVRSPSSTTNRVVAAAVTDSWPPSCGAQLGKYLLTERVGQGTTGLVFRAVNQMLNLSVAVKILKLGEQSSRQADLESLQAEARLLASLNHPNVVRLWDYEADPDRPYLVMEYVEGPSLAELIKQSGRLAPDRAVQLALKVLDGLAAAWALGIVHRDVKPHNILITREGEPKLADLGLAVVVDANGHSGVTSGADLAGTAAYMAPEQGVLAGNGIDFRADVYSLGASLYHALTGQLPFTGGSARELMIKHVQERPAPPHQRVPGLPEAYSDVVLTMMARDPDDRYQTAAEVKEALKGLLANSAAPAPAAPAATTESTRRVRPSGFIRRLLTGK